MTPLLKFFITATIGWKDYTVIDKEIAVQLQGTDTRDEFHIEPIGNGLYQLWTKERWNKKSYIDKALDEAAKSVIDDQVMKYNKAMEYLTTQGNLSEEDAREMLSMTTIRQKFGLT